MPGGVAGAAGPVLAFDPRAIPAARPAAAAPPAIAVHRIQRFEPFRARTVFPLPVLFTGASETY